MERPPTFPQVFYFLCVESWGIVRTQAPLKQAEIYRELQALTNSLENRVIWVQLCKCFQFRCWGPEFDSVPRQALLKLFLAKAPG